ncbi:MAG TPA: hypothetical protein VIJ07_26255, partial [Dermatophilaceae bacterium]
MADWIAEKSPAPFPAAARCLAVVCGRDRLSVSGLCSEHRQRFHKWRKSRQHLAGDDVAMWLSREVEPHMDPETRATYSAAGAT